MCLKTDTLRLRTNCFNQRIVNINKHIGPLYSRTEIYAARHNAADEARRPPLHGFAAAVRAASGTDRRTRHRCNTLIVFAVA